MKASSKQKLISTLFASLMTTSLLLTGCSGGSSNTTSNATNTVNRGVITGFGSVYVNGIKFETNNSKFSIDNSIDTDQSNLKVGMVVTVNGTVNADGTTGTASFIQYDNELKGPVSNITAYDPLTLERTFTLLGQTVTVNADTVFDDDENDLPLTLDTLVDGNVIEVSGLITDTGLTATHIEGQSATFEEYVANSGEIEIVGSVTTLTGSTLADITFQIGTQEILTDANTELDNLTLEEIVDGVYIEVKGTLDSYNKLVATKIESKSKGLGDSDIDKAEIEGIISTFDDTAKTFVIQGQVVDFSSTILFPTSLSLNDGLTVEAEGAVVNGILIADKIKQKGKKIKIKGRISAIDLDNETITFSFNSTDIIVRVNAQTELKVDGITSPTINDFYIGDFVKMKAFYDGTQTINAIELKTKDSDNDVEIQASVEAFNAINGTITVLGVQFDLSAANFDSALVSDIFYNSLSIGEFVSLKDNNPSDGIIDEIELED